MSAPSAAAPSAAAPSAAAAAPSLFSRFTGMFGLTDAQKAAREKFLSKISGATTFNQGVPISTTVSRRKRTRKQRKTRKSRR